MNKAFLKTIILSPFLLISLILCINIFIIFTPLILVLLPIRIGIGLIDGESVIAILAEAKDFITVFSFFPLKIILGEIKE